MSAGSVIQRNEYYCSAQIPKEKNIPLFIEQNANFPEGRLRNPLADRERAVINLQHVAPENYRTVMYELDINIDAALANLYQYLGKGDRAVGSQYFEELKANGLITVERVGFSKQGRPKFYLMVNKQSGAGGNNGFHIGVSQRGTLRGINRNRHQNDLILMHLNKIGNYARAIHHRLGKYSSISRVMNYEAGVRVSELGQEDLSKIDVNKLTKQDRIKIYVTLIRGIDSLHKNKLTHNDLKLENVVICRNASGEITGIKIIDLDTLAIEYIECVQEGTPHIIAPERLIRQQQNGFSVYPLHQMGIANTKEDLWAAMLIICEIEARIASPSMQLLSRPFIERFTLFYNSFYQGKIGNSREEKTLNALKQRTEWIQSYLLTMGKDNLFAELPIVSPFDFLVHSIAYLNPSLRVATSQLLLTIHHEEELGSAWLKLQKQKQRIQELKAQFFHASEELCAFFQYEPVAVEAGTPIQVLQERRSILQTVRDASLQHLSEAIRQEIHLAQTGLLHLKALPIRHPAYQNQKICSELTLKANASQFN